MRFRLVVAILVCLVAPTLEAQVPELLYLKLNEGSGSASANAAFPGLPGAAPILRNGATWETGNPRLGAAALKIGPSLFAADLATQAPFSLAGDFTIEIWFREDPGGSLGFKALFAEDSLGPFQLTKADEAFRLDGPVPQVALAWPARPGVWQHIALVQDTAEMSFSLLIDGVLRSKFPLTTPVVLSGSAADGLRLGNGGFIDSWVGALDEFRVWSHARSEAEIQATMNQELSSFAQDLAVVSVRNPVFDLTTRALPSNFEPVSATIENLGSTLVPSGTSFMLSYQVDNGPVVTETAVLAADLATGDRFTHVFGAVANLATPNHHDVVVSLSWTADQNPANDARKRAIGGGGVEHLIDRFPWTEGFENAFWNLNYWGVPQWRHEFGAGGLPGFFFAAKPMLGAPSSGHGIWAEDGPFWAECRLDGSLVSPLLDLRALVNPRLRFWLHADPVQVVNSPGLVLDVITRPGGAVSSAVWGPVGGVLGPDWIEQEVDLSAHVGQLVELRFRGAPPLPLANPISIDDLIVYDHLGDVGQPPRAGLAEFDLGQARNLSYARPSSLENGPYYSQLRQFAQMDLVFGGLPNAAVILLAGPLGTQAATYGPAIGQLDIGGPVNPTTGIPFGIVVIFNGLNTTGLDPFFRIPNSGRMLASFPVPALPPGIVGTFQALLVDPSTGAPALSNAIQLEIRP
ncbi:MAG: LamG domain-containing protein [Planctomycetes bacterium]|nr:LamG domain-containing protein [Planctomycetota bacterium]